MNTLKSYNEVMDYLLYNEKQCQEITLELNENHHHYSKEEMEETRKKLSHEYSHHFDEYKRSQGILTRTTTFHTNDLIEFFKPYYEAAYGIEYDGCIDMKDRPHEEDSNSYNVIVSKRDTDRIFSSVEDPTNIDVHSFLAACQDPCICLENDSEITLLRGKAINPEFAHVPEIESITSKLVDLSLGDHTLSDKIRLLAVLKVMVIEVGTREKQLIAMLQHQTAKQTEQQEQSHIEEEHQVTRHRVLTEIQNMFHHHKGK